MHIAALPAIAQLWLPSRLERLRNAFPQLNFSVTALETPPTLSREMFDLSIFFEEPNDNSDQIVLAHDIIFPVCAPKLAEGFAKGSARLLHDQGWSSGWRLWAEQTGAEMDALNAGARYSLYGLAVEEAKAGAGILMGHACLIDSLLKTGQLVPASLKQAKTGRAMVLNLPNSPTRRPVVDNIAAHLVGQIGSTN
ncbi:LysR substrate-binding domain-containing protein [Cohaesibacter marisflavi]